MHSGGNWAVSYLNTRISEDGLRYDCDVCIRPLGAVDYLSVV